MISKSWKINLNPSKLIFLAGFQGIIIVSGKYCEQVDIKYLNNAQKNKTQKVINNILEFEKDFRELKDRKIRPEKKKAFHQKPFTKTQKVSTLTNWYIF